jgi:Na+/H+ antiporter 1
LPAEDRQLVYDLRGREFNSPRLCGPNCFEDLRWVDRDHGTAFALQIAHAGIATGVVAELILGKPLGIVAAAFAAVKFGIAKLPSRHLLEIIARLCIVGRHRFYDVSVHRDARF